MISIIIKIIIKAIFLIKKESNSFNVNNNPSIKNDIKNSLNEFSLFNKENIEDFDYSNILNSQINKTVPNNNQIKEIIQLIIKKI